MSDLLEWARRYAAAGISTMPIGDDKKPLVKWTHRQKDTPSDKSLSTDYRKQGVAGIGGITGEVSGDLILVELEAIGVLEILDDFKGRLDDEDPGLWDRIEQGWSQDSPRGGVHLLARVDGGSGNGSRRLAARYATEEEVQAGRLVGKTIGQVLLCETREEGGYVGLAPGRTVDGEYRIRHGGPETVATITKTELDTILSVVAGFNEIAAAPVSDGPLAPSNLEAVGTRPGDIFNAVATWEDVLILRRDADDRAILHSEADGVGYWTRPGKKASEGYSATTNALGTDRLINFSSNWPQFDSEQHADEAGNLRRTSYSKFDVEAIYARGGDRAACARQLAKEGFGIDRLASLRPDLPEAVTPVEALALCTRVFQEWMIYEDPTPIRVMAAVVDAGEQDGDPPLGVFLVGPSSSGKTETLMSLSRHQGAEVVSSISSEAALLSATSEKDRSKSATGGILRSMGSQGLMLVKDFTSILSMNRETRQQILAAIREIMDGSWSRVTGTEGGLKLTWEGKITIIAAVTPAVDRHRQVIGTMGERLVTIRMPAPDPTAQAKMALAGHRSGSVDHMRAELRAAMEQVLDFASAQPAPAMSPETVQWLAELATFGVRMRSPVDRDPTNRYEISTIPEPEHPPRLAIALRQIWEAMHRIGCTTAEAENGVEQIVRDSIPPDRLIVFDFLARETLPVRTADVGKLVSASSSTVRRRLEDLEALGVVVKSGDEDRGYEWELSVWGKENTRYAT